MTLEWTAHVRVTSNSRSARMRKICMVFRFRPGYAHSTTSSGVANSERVAQGVGVLRGSYPHFLDYPFRKKNTDYNGPL